MMISVNSFQMGIKLGVLTVCAGVLLIGTAADSHAEPKVKTAASVQAGKKAAPRLSTHAHAGHGHDHVDKGMATIGKMAPNFLLRDTAGNEHQLKDYAGKVVVLEWFNPDCPFVKKHHKLNKSMASSFSKAKDQEVVWLAINSGGPGKQGNGLERNAKAREEYGIEYPILMDESGVVGKAFGAKTTPHMFIINAAGALVYAGSLDDNKSPDTVGKTNYVIDALENCVGGNAVDVSETKSYGCSVKYAS